ncbi:unnamed protein product [Linum trigynum]|uniref:Uncharacterized protein n=1 Tax=Linum trigynum TaxID=586398 RepID=A0AAV2E4R6_9ROSI
MSHYPTRTLLSPHSILLPSGASPRFSADDEHRDFHYADSAALLDPPPATPNGILLSGCRYQSRYTIYSDLTFFRTGSSDADWQPPAPPFRPPPQLVGSHRTTVEESWWRSYRCTTTSKADPEIRIWISYMVVGILKRISNSESDDPDCRAEGDGEGFFSTGTLIERT